MITFNNIGNYGRFGNQLFQFASVIGIGDKLNYDVVFPKKNLSPITTSTTRENKNFVAYFEINECFDVDQNFFTDDLIIEHNASERFFHFDENLFNISDNTNVSGYLQSEKYFKHCSDKIKNILTFKESVLTSAKSFLPKTDKTLVSIHVRRTDAAVPNPYHPLTGLDFFNPAIDHFNKDEHHFVVCSDDYDWCNSVWGNDENFTVINSNSPYIDLCIMSLCDHHIISNSSFSWWSSYLSKNENKKIIAPINWLGPAYSSYNLDDLYTENMIKL
jgi:hypothetical protein